MTKESLERANQIQNELRWLNNFRKKQREDDRETVCHVFNIMWNKGLKELIETYAQKLEQEFEKL